MMMAKCHDMLGSYLLSLLSVDLCIGGCKASDQWKLVCELCDALCIHANASVVFVSSIIFVDQYI